MKEVKNHCNRLSTARNSPGLQLTVKPYRIERERVLNDIVDFESNGETEHVMKHTVIIIIGTTNI